MKKLIRRSPDKAQKRVRFTVFSKIVIGLLALTLLPLTALSYLTLRSSRLTLIAAHLSTFTELADSTARYVDLWLEDHQNEIHVLTHGSDLVEASAREAGEILADSMENLHDYEALYLAGTDGRVIASVSAGGKSGGKTLPGQDAFQKALKGETAISEVYRSAGGKPAIAVASPVHIRDAVKRVVVAEISIEQLYEGIETHLGETGELYLINGQGYLISPSRFNQALVAEGLVKTGAELELKIDTTASQAVLARKAGAGEYTGYRGETVLGAYQPLKSAGWGLIVEQSSDEVLQDVAQLRRSVIGVALILAFIVCAAGYSLAQSVSSPLKELAHIASRLAQGEIDHELKYHSDDEVGALANAFREMIAYQREMARIASAMAGGDLTQMIAPKSSKDVLGMAFTQMVFNMDDMITTVTENAHQLTAASRDLASAAVQAGQATGQIAATVQQVARGSAQQSEAVAQTATSVEQVSRAIDGVARGAQEQAAAVAQASEATLRLNEAIQEVASAAEENTRGTVSAAQAAREGARRVEETMQGMNAIRSHVNLSAEKVEEMGRRSDEIGAIVEVIEDIASQTNLLALNAAIEAARAGEHGKGFAVVADEVRKLAERSSAATKEIAAIIRGIQISVSEAVQAMTESAGEVEQGVEKAQEAGQSLQAILTAVEDIREKTEASLQALQRMQTMSNQLVSAVDSVSAVVEENTAATEEMAASAGEMTQMIEDIAGVSSQNSAAIEEVSAGAEEVTAQVEEVTAAAQSLADLAVELQEAVRQFRLKSEEEFLAEYSPVAHREPVKPAEKRPERELVPA